MSVRARLRGPEAERLAALRGLLADLDDVVAFCERLELLSADRDADDAPRQSLEFQAFWIAALVTYARCFDTSRRGLSLDPAEIVPEDSQSWHETFVGLRDQHFVHAVDRRLEGFFVDAVLSPPASGVRKVVEVLTLGFKRTAASSEHVDELLRLARKVRQRAETRLEVVRAGVLVQAQGRPVDELYATPASELVLPPRTGVRKRIGRGRGK